MGFQPVALTRWLLGPGELSQLCFGQEQAIENHGLRQRPSIGCVLKWLSAHAYFEKVPADLRRGFPKALPHIQSKRWFSLPFLKRHSLGPTV